MLRCSRVTRAALLSATVLRRTTVPPRSTPVESPKPAAADAAVDSSSPLQNHGEALQHMTEETNAPSPHLAEEAAPPPPPMHRQPKFLFKGRRGSMSPEYYSSRSSVGHPDPLAELIGAGRADPEWMWLKLLCFFCVASTIGTTLYGYFFAEHVKYFKDEPWSPFTY